MRDLDYFLQNIKKIKLKNGVRKVDYGIESIYYDGDKSYISMGTFSTKLVISLQDDCRHKLTYDPGMDHLIFHCEMGSYEVNRITYRPISLYLDEAYSFQQSLLQEVLFSTESLQKLFELHETIDRLANPEKYKKEKTKCTLLSSLITFVKQTFSF